MVLYINGIVDIAKYAKYAIPKTSLLSKFVSIICIVQKISVSLINVGTIYCAYIYKWYMKIVIVSVSEYWLRLYQTVLPEIETLKLSAFLIKY